MTEFKGTPGPWFWTEENGQATALMAAGGKWVADPQCDISEYGLKAFHWTDVSKEDAALIAAAPELLEALRELQAVVNGEASWLLDEDRNGFGRVAEQVSTAIAKALGEGQ